MSRIKPREFGGEVSRLAALAEIAARFPRLPNLVRDLLVAQPSVFWMFVKLQRCVELGLLSAEDLVKLVRKWADSLPDRRGRVVDLHVQPDLPLDLPGRPPLRTKRKRKKRPRGS